MYLSYWRALYNGVQKNKLNKKAQERLLTTLPFSPRPLKLGLTVF